MAKLTKKQLAYLFAVVYKRQRGAGRRGRVDAKVLKARIDAPDTMAHLTKGQVAEEVRGQLRRVEKTWGKVLIDRAVRHVIVCDNEMELKRRLKEDAPWQTGTQKLRNLIGLCRLDTIYMNGASLEAEAEFKDRLSRCSRSDPGGAWLYLDARAKEARAKFSGCFDHEVGHAVANTMTDLRLPRTVLSAYKKVAEESSRHYNGMLLAEKLSREGRSDVVWQDGVGWNASDVRKTISSYSLKSTSEHQAEAIEAYVHERATLRKKAPALCDALDGLTRETRKIRRPWWKLPNG